MVELTLKTCEPLTDLVEDVVKFAIHVIVLVELRLVFHSLFSRDYGCVGPATTQKLSIRSKLFQLGTKNISTRLQFLTKNI